MRVIFTLILVSFISSCSSSVQNIGNIGPNNLKVYSIKDSDFLSANRMLVILDKSGNVAAFSGGTVTGLGAVSMQAAGSAAIAGATIIGANALKHGLENAHLSSSHAVSIDVTGQLKHP
jgi:hypothetical protein